MQEQARSPLLATSGAKPTRLVDRIGDELVIGAGLLTTALALGLVYLVNANAEDFNVMGFYLWFIVPIGAILVGVAAGSGYGIASWMSDLKIGGALLWIVGGLLVLSYFAANYLEFRSLGPLAFDDGSAVSFWAYFDHVTRNQGYQVDGKTVAETLGAWGYGLRLLEVVGYAGGGLAVPIAMMRKPYCDTCRRYMRSRNLLTLPASIADKKPKKKDADGIAAWEKNREAAWNGGHETVQRFLDANQQQDVTTLAELLAAHRGGNAAANKLPVRLSVTSSLCKCCHRGFFAVTRLSGQGNQIQIAPLGTAAIDPRVGVTLG